MTLTSSPMKRLLIGTVLTTLCGTASLVFSQENDRWWESSPPGEFPTRQPDRHGDSSSTYNNDFSSSPPTSPSEKGAFADQPVANQGQSKGYQGFVPPPSQPYSSRSDPSLDFSNNAGPPANGSGGWAPPPPAGSPPSTTSYGGGNGVYQQQIPPAEYPNYRPSNGGNWSNSASQGGYRSDSMPQDSMGGGVPSYSPPGNNFVPYPPTNYPDPRSYNSGYPQPTNVGQQPYNAPRAEPGYPPQRPNMPPSYGNGYPNYPQDNLPPRPSYVTPPQPPSYAVPQRSFPPSSRNSHTLPNQQGYMNDIPTYPPPVYGNPPLAYPEKINPMDDSEIGRRDWSAPRENSEESKVPTSFTATQPEMTKPESALPPPPALDTKKDAKDSLESPMDIKAAETPTNVPAKSADSNTVAPIN
ncbi:MAG: hypothetical protein H7832_05650 [Magnetococcus sp. DMHC-6]